MRKLCVIILSTLFIQSVEASKNCFTALDSLLTKETSSTSTFRRRNKKTIKKLSDLGIINQDEIKPENILIVRNKKNLNISHILKSNENLILFDSSLSNGYEIAQGKAFGFTSFRSLEERYDILKGSFVIKTLKEETTLLPKSQFGDKAVSDFLKENNSANTEHIKKWEKELQYLVSTPLKDPSGNYTAFPVQALEKAQFYKVSLISRPGDRLTLMTFNGKTYFLTKKRYPWLATSENSGLLNPLQVAYLAQGKVLKFQTKDGGKIYFSSVSQKLYIDQSKALVGLFDILKKGNPKATNSFEEYFADDLLELIIENDLSSIQKTQIFSVTGKKNEYVLFLNDQIFYFSKDNRWAEITKEGLGFTHPKGQNIVLDNKFILKTTKQNITLVPIAEKSPVFLDEIATNPKLPQTIKDIVNIFKVEFGELLENTHFTKSHFLNAAFQIVIDTKTGKQMVYMDSKDLHVIFSPEMIPGDKLFDKKRMHILKEQTNIGFESFEERTFLLGQSVELKLSAKGLNITPIELDSFTKANLDKLLSDEVDLHPFQKEMISLHRTELESLINRRLIKLDEILPNRSSFAILSDGSKSYWAIPTKDDILLFDLKTSNPPISFMAKNNQLPQNKILMESGVTKERKSAIGFSISRDPKTLIETSQHPQEIKKVFFSKINHILSRNLVDAEKNTILKALAIGLSEVGADGKTQALIGNFTEAQILEKVKVLKGSEFFTDQEIEKLFNYRFL